MVKRTLVITNLKPAKMQGIEITAMMLVAVAPDDAKIQLLDLPAGIEEGEVISFEGVKPVDFGGGAPMLKRNFFSRFGIGFRNRRNEAVYFNGDKESAFTTRLGQITIPPEVLEAGGDEGVTI
mmetsp:Transcript_43641/g.44156  ORF Transcript_43641/g.44156 Transcript_43641/m.44156 type:complete len:123 (-) Transcript_43641:144-512(-)